MNHDTTPAIVTGGSGKIGASAARRLAAGGHPVTLVCHRDTAAAEATAEEIRGRGGRCVTVQADVADSAAVDKLFAEAEAAHGPAGILINAAGALHDALLIEMTDEQWQAGLAVNLTGSFLCSRRAASAMIRARWGRIVNVSSAGALLGVPGQANYGAAKAGLIGLTRAIARELAGRNVTCNAVLPGPVTAKIIDHLGQDRLEELRRQVPMGRFGTADQVSAAVCFLCETDASFITGAIIPVDGGMAMGC